MSGRLEEMPGEEGYPAYLTSRIAQFYERAGVVETMGTEERRGSITAIGAVSPPGGDLSEPVSQGTMRIVKVFWSLDSSLAYARHFPAINWLTSYSLYTGNLKGWYDENMGETFVKNREKAMSILQEEASLNEIVRLVGRDSLGAMDQLTLETAKMLREDFLQQNAFMDVDSYSELNRQAMLLAIILKYDTLGRDALNRGADMNALFSLPAKEQIGRAKYIAADAYEETYNKIDEQMQREIEEAAAAGGEDR